ncbi:MAG: YciI family protein, partial [Thermoleophilaceae bacterium]
KRRGVLIASDPLQPPDTATTVHTEDGELLTTDGPFAETTEWLGGFFMLDCDDLDEALELARLCPVARYGKVEVRPLLEGGPSHRAEQVEAAGG